MKKCTKCGNENKEYLSGEREYCVYCGEKLYKTEIVTTNNSNPKGYYSSKNILGQNLKSIGLIIIVLGSIIGVVSLFQQLLIGIVCIFISVSLGLLFLGMSEIVFKLDVVIKKLNEK